MNPGRILISLLTGLILFAPTAAVRADEGEDEKDDKPMSAGTFAGLKLRGIGPALMSGRVGDFAVNPDNPAQYFVAVCSGGVWKTTNAGTTWTPVFDGEGSYSIGCVTLDPKNPHVVWVGAGENNSQRSVSFGDGVYRSRDGGKSWQNMGLKESEHIGTIAIDPRNSDVVYVAAQGPLWRSGGDRGLYKTTDGGKTWDRVLHVSDDTGVNEVHLDPRDSNVLYASSYQRRRHVWTLINGGPESAVHKSTDAGKTWRKITRGLPSEDKGRIGLDISPANPDVVYAIVEAAEDKGGFFRSTDRGETWEKRSGYKTSSPQYYNEIFCDPVEVDRVYALDTIMQVTEDGGKTFRGMPRRNRHVDDHALWIDPKNNEHLLVGCDGGIYETYDRGQAWGFKANLPITQFYRVSVDNSEPFYYVYGGTQDNNSKGGPSRTTDVAGITNADWFITVGGDGYETQVDPEDPNTVYSLWQYGGLVRHDRRSGETVDIKPREAPDDEPYKWNWDTPLIISPHSHTRLYVAAQRLFRSDDRGDSWTPISGDLTRRTDRNQLEVMGRIQNADAVAKNQSTSFYGNCVSLTESPLEEGLIYVGTDDGLVQVTEDGGENWRSIGLFPGVPDNTYVSCLTASSHNADRVYAAFDNHKQGDFKPYLLRSDDRGRNWTNVAGDLPARDIAYSIAEDHEKPDLLFAGTEFGVYFTIDGGEKWIKLKGGMPTIAVRDIAVQRRENDLALATFGRGFYILDDYTPLRAVGEEFFKQDAAVFPIKPALSYVESSRLGGRGAASQGASYFLAPNPPFGAVFTYYLKDKLTTRRERRKEAEKKAEKSRSKAPYPTMDELRAEDEEREPKVLLIVRDEEDHVIRRITGSRSKGIHRASWDLRYPAYTPTQLRDEGDRPDWVPEPAGPLALPGTYSVQLAKEVDGVVTPLAEPKPFEVVALDNATFAAKDKPAVLAFRKKIGDLQRAVAGSLRAAGEAETRMTHLRKALLDTPKADLEALADLQELQARLNRALLQLRGDPTRAKRSEPTPPSINERVQDVVSSQWYTTQPPTKTQEDAYRYAGEAFAKVLDELQQLIEKDLAAFEKRLEDAGGPWTPGRVPRWPID